MRSAQKILKLLRSVFIGFGYSRASLTPTASAQMSKGMQFVATHNVTADDVACASRLGARRVDLLLSVIVVVVLIGILAQVLYSFALYLLAVAHAPEKLVGLLRFETGEIGVAALTWLSILYLFYCQCFCSPHFVRSLTRFIQLGGSGAE